MKPSCLTFVFCLCLAVAASGQPASTPNPQENLDAWLNAQTNLHTWSADFVQTRNLKTLTRPLTARGKVWFASPNRFRWQLEPAHTIVVRGPRELLIFYPRLKRVEKMDLSGGSAGPWRDALALLEAGFPRSRNQLEAQYDILGLSQTNAVCAISLRPKSASARKMMPRISIEFSAKDLSLTATELEFADGSSMRNDFSNPVLNPPVDPALFSPEIPAGYIINEPLRKRRD